MNILQLVPKLNVGGVEKGTVEVARFLTLKGHKAVVVSGGGELEKNLAAIGARHYCLPVGRKNPFVMLYCYFRLKQIIKKENIDIVHARSRIPALSGYFAAHSTQRVFITTAHGQYKKHLISHVMGWGKIVIVANETMARYMNENFGVNLQKMVIIPRGVDLEKFSFIPPSAKKGKTFRVGMIARYSPIKGHLDFLKAISYVSRKIHNLEVVIMGDKRSAKEEYLKKLELTARRLMVDKIVKFNDSDRDVADVLANLEVLVSANTEQEAFGRTVIEAQARGVPVVATRIGGVVENIADGVTGLLCEPMDPRDIAEKIMSYASSYDLMKNVARQARGQVENKYALQKMMEMELAAYSDVLVRKNILVLKISSLGDIILSVPSLRAIRKRFQNASIKVLVDVRFRDVLDGCPYIDEIITCDLNGRDKGGEFWRFARKLRAEGFDISIDLQNNRKSHLVSFLAAIPERYGYNNGKWSFLINRKTGLPGKPVPPVEHQACVLALAGITRVDPYLELWAKPESVEWAENFLRDSWLKKDQKLVAVSLSASKRWRTKNWGVSQMAELTDMLAKEKGIRVVALGVEDDSSEGEDFFKKTSAKPINAIGKTDTSRLISLIKRCDALVTGDSAPMHIASATGTPFVAMFGPTDPERHAPVSGKKKVIKKNMRCSPCYKTSCIKGVKCMTSIKVREVFDALVEVMEK
jgi:lipopolysaccharide heptosyltransferase II